MEIRVATEDDFDTVYNMWKAERKVLGPPWKSTLTDQLKKQEFHLAYDGEQLVGMVCLHYSKKYVRYEIIALVVLPEFRRKGYASEMLEYVLNTKTQKKTLLGDVKIPVLLGALDGAENNKFYDTFCTVEWFNEYKTCRTRVYQVDEERLHAINKARKG